MQLIKQNLPCALRLSGLALGALLLTAHGADQPQWGQAWTRDVSWEKGAISHSSDPARRAIVGLAELTASSPVIARGRIYIGTNNGHPRDPAHQGDRGVLMCLDEKTGRFRWQLVFPKRTEDIYYDWPNSGIASPATVEGDRVYIVNNRGEVLCVEEKPETNQPPSLPEPSIIWRFDLTSGAGIWSHDAAHSSILIHGDYLYLNSGTGVDNTHRKIRTPDAPSLVVLDKKTGRLVARDDEHIAPTIFHSTWSAPSLATVNGRPLLFFAAGNGIVYAFETVGAGVTNPPASLRRVWQFDFDPGAPKTNVHRFTSNRREGPSDFFGMPVFQHDRIYVAGGGDIGGQERGVAQVHRRHPHRRHHHQRPRVVLSLAEARPVHARRARRPRLHRRLRRMFHCVDAQTGKPHWTHDVNGEVWASPLVADGKVYLGTRSGSFYTFAASKDKKVLNNHQLGRPISATATAANGEVVRGHHEPSYAVQQGAGAQ